MSQAVSNSITSRRSLLAGLAVSPIIAAPAVLAAGAPTDDAELIELGRRFDEGVAIWEAAQPDYWAASAGFDQALADHREELSLAQKENGVEGWSAVCRRVAGHHDAVISKWNDFLEENVDPLQERILKLPAFTVAGLAVKARVLGFNKSRAWDREPPDLDYDLAIIRNLVENACALVGVDRFGQPLAATPA
jgi:hypothetical protein